MKKYNELNFDERREITSLFANWLETYTHEVIVNVLNMRDDIINDERTMNMLMELKKREEKEREDFGRSMDNLLSNFDTFKEYDPHNHCLTHSSSYRDVLYDMYIADSKGE